MSREISLTWPQTQIWQHPARFKTVIAGRRFGKTFYCISRMYTLALERPNQEIWYLAPTYRMAKRITWRPLKRLVDPRSLKHKHETDLTIELINGSIISLFGADEPDSLRGSGLNHAVLDEFPLMKPEVWYEAIRPALADRMGSADLIGTPRGHNWAYDLCQEIKDKTVWKYFEYTTAQGGNVPPSELEDAKSSMDARTYRQEFEASFEALTGRVYDNFERAANIDPELKDRGDIIVGIDFNVNPMNAVIMVRQGEECHVIDALQIPTSNTDEVAQEIRRRYPLKKIICCPDPSGIARKTSAPVGQTDFTILKSYGFELVAPRRAPLVSDRINAVQAMLCDANGRRRLLIHPDAKPLIMALEGQTYKEGTSIPEKGGSPDLSGPVDALGYPIWSLFNLLKVKSEAIASTSQAGW